MISQFEVIDSCSLPLLPRIEDKVQIQWANTYVGGDFVSLNNNFDHAYDEEVAEDNKKAEIAPQARKGMKRSDYENVKYLGKGSYGQVNLVSLNDAFFALKEVDKDFVIKHDKTESVFRERDILQ